MGKNWFLRGMHREELGNIQGGQGRLGKHREDDGCIGKLGVKVEGVEEKWGRSSSVSQPNAYLGRFFENLQGIQEVSRECQCVEDVGSVREEPGMHREQSGKGFLSIFCS